MRYVRLCNNVAVEIISQEERDRRGPHWADFELHATPEEDIGVRLGRRYRPTLDKATDALPVIDIKTGKAKAGLPGVVPL